MSSYLHAMYIHSCRMNQHLINPIDKCSKNKIKFRCIFNPQHVSLRLIICITGAVSVPVVCVVLEGGPGTLETVKSAIQNGTPAVIVEVKIK